tara:strand:+ start:160 stop:465 length:306 start_codon:yes stop_codon:yes gene_type:complete
MYKLLSKIKYPVELTGKFSERVYSKYILLAEHLMFTRREGEAERLLESLDFNQDDIKSFLTEVRFARDHNLATVELSPDDVSRLIKGDLPLDITVKKSLLN